MGLGSGLISESMEFGFWEVRLEVEEEFGISGKLVLFY